MCICVLMIDHILPYSIQGVIPNYYCSDPYPTSILREKWNLTQEEIFKITAPPDEIESRQQCHLVARNYNRLTQQDIEALLAKSGIMH